MNGLSLYDLRLFLPETLLGVTMLVLFAGDLLIRRTASKRRLLPPVALLGLAATAAAVLVIGREPATSAFYGQIAVDPIGTVFKLLFLAVTTVGILSSMLSKELPDEHMGEYFALLVSITFGMFLMAGANDLLMVFLATEFVSIVSYAMAGYRARDRRSSEAALKYAVYGGAASGLMLFGISLFYGMLGTTELTAVHRALTEWDVHNAADMLTTGARTFPLTLLLSIVFIFAGLGYKIAVVPFHMWSPDVYEGAPTPFTGFLSVGPKAAGFALLARFFIGAFVAPGEAHGFAADANGMMKLAIDLPLPAMLGIVAAVTMTLGNLAAIPQNNVKRLLAYSSIAHAGYLLMGFVVLSESSLHAVLFYVVIYYVMNIGAFLVCQAVRDRTGGELIHDFRGLGTKEPLLAIAMTIFLLSLTGLPPLAGFIGKFYLFASVMQRGGFWYVVLAVIGVLNSAVSLYYYMKVAKSMWLSSPADEKPFGAHPAYVALAAVLAVPMLVLGLYWTPISGPIRSSIGFFRSAPPAQAAQVTPAP